MRCAPAVAALAVAALPAQELVREIQPFLAQSRTSNPQNFCTAAGFTWFAADDAQRGVELWRTDGTPAGTQMFADLVPGAAGSFPALLREFAGGLAFANINGLCWTNGTPGNVVVLGPWAANGTTNGQPFVVGTRLFYVAAFQPQGHELWQSDGTPGGTALVADILPGSGSSSPRSFCALNGVLYFVATDATFASRLWRSDGTAPGTFEVAPGAPYGACDEVAVAGGRVFFGSSNSHELWQSNGTAAGTTLVHSGFLLGPADLTGGAGKLVFTAGDASTGAEPWTSDGTAVGTVPLADTAPGAAHGLFGGHFTVFGTHVFFIADDGVHGVEPWVSDLTPAGTALLRDLNPGSGWSAPGAAAASGGGVFFAADGGAGYELWFTDGTANGTRLVRDLRQPGQSEPGAFTGLGALTVFSADDGVHGREPWVTDGSANGTRLLRDIAAPALSANPLQFVQLGKHTLFTADDGVHGIEPWVTDGTRSGTQLLVDTAPGTSSGGYTPLGQWRGKLWFTVHGNDLWSTDGTPAGTQLVANLGTLLPNVLWFVGLDDLAILGGENRLCTFDGTAAGITLLPLASTTQMSSGARFGAFAYFLAADAVHGRELWRTDGSAAGTAMFYEFTPGPDGSVVGGRVVGDRLYLRASTGVSPTFPFGPLDIEPWVTDGTAAGTVRLGDLAPGTNSSLPDGFVQFAGAVWFFAADAAGLGLYRTDGTPTGTIRFFGATTYPFNVAVAGQRLFFDNNGEVWSTDGTLAGTFASLDIAPGAASSQTSDFAPVGASTLLAFSAVVPGESRSLWLTDGTAAGTQRVNGLTLTGPGGRVTRSGTDLLLAADDGVHGQELYALRLRSLAASMADTLGDGCRGALGTPRIEAPAGPRLGSPFAIQLDGAPANAPVFAAHAFQLLPGGDRAGCAAALDLGTGVSLFLLADSQGHATTSLFVPNAPFALGLEFYSQWVAVDPAGQFLGALSLSPVLDWLVGS